MIYFLYGESSYHAFRKIKEFKDAFQKKNSGVLIEEYDGDLGELSLDKFHAALGQANLFSDSRLVIFKNIIAESKDLINELKSSKDSAATSKDVFVFWERNPEAAALTYFKKYAEKTQEVSELKITDLDKWLDKKAKSLDLKLDKNERELMIEAAGESPEWGLESALEKLFLGGVTENINTKTAVPSPFAFADKMLGSRALIVLKEMFLSGIQPQQFIYAFLWKLKQRRMCDAYFEGVKAESRMRRDPKNAEEILERFIFLICFN